MATPKQDSHLLRLGELESPRGRGRRPLTEAVRPPTLEGVCVVKVEAQRGGDLVRVGVRVGVRVRVGVGVGVRVGVRVRVGVGVGVGVRVTVRVGVTVRVRVGVRVRVRSRRSAAATSSGRRGARVQLP